MLHFRVNGCEELAQVITSYHFSFIQARLQETFSIKLLLATAFGQERLSRHHWWNLQHL